MNQSDKYSFFRSKNKLDTQMDVVDSLGWLYFKMT